MKRKGLIITATIALLAVSCGKNGNKTQKGYGKFLEAVMKDAFGEVLPYVSLNKDTLYYGFEYYDGEGYFFVGDDNETNLLEKYDQKLTKAGYEFVEPEEGEDFDPYFYKETETNEIYVTYAYYEATEDYEAGNEIDVEFYYEDPQYESISLELGNLFFNDLGLKNTLQLPDYEGEEIYKGVSLSGALGIFEIDIYNSSQEEMDAYAEALEEAGFVEGEPEYAGDYFFYDDKTYATIEVQNWIGFSYDCVRILFYAGEAPEPPLSEFPADLVVEFLSGYGVTVSEDIFPEYDGNAETYFEYDDSWSFLTNATDVYVMNTTNEELADYVDAMEDNGWTLKSYEPEFDEEDDEVIISEEYYLVYSTDEDQPGDVGCLIGNYLVENDYVDFMIGAVAKPAPVEFPAEAIKADLEDNGIETDTLPVYSGEGTTGFQYIPISNGGQLQILTETGAEQDVISTYQADLLTAGYTEAGADQYGDMHYTSPNDGIDVVVWDGNDIDYPGYVFVDIKLPPQASTAFPVATVNQFLAEYDLGFVISANTFADNEDGYELTSGYNSYHYLFITVSGNHVEEFETALAPILTAAGYEFSSYSDANNRTYLNDDWHEVDIKYNSTEDYTQIRFWE